MGYWRIIWFRGDFNDYVECNIPVNDTARTNTVIGIGTTCTSLLTVMAKMFKSLASLIICHMLNSVYSVSRHIAPFMVVAVPCLATELKKLIDMLQITTPIEDEASNAPMIIDCAVSFKEIAELVPTSNQPFSILNGRLISFVDGAISILTL